MSLNIQEFLFWASEVAKWETQLGKRDENRCVYPCAHMHVDICTGMYVYRCDK